MRWKSSIGVLVLSLGLQTGVPSAALAGSPTEQLRGSVDKAVKLAGEGAGRREAPRERRVALRKIADEIFDWGETAKRSLGMHWRERTPAEREEFVRLFADLLERSYMTKIELYDGERIGYAGDTIDGDQAIVRTKLVNKQGGEMAVNYRMVKGDGERWKVYDVEIEGVSLVANYRTQFNNLLRRSTYPDLVRALRAKATEPEVEAVMASPASAK
ncbi:MAG TPA: ABC transporter substrate-binding protein [Candidatus Acidoferrum sp.]|nr:ABC transporter substrate-binding protein [Candidatus Acidoferrum sp.]